MGIHPAGISTFTRNAKGNRILVWWDPAEAVAAGAVELAAELAVGAVTVGSVGWKWLSIGDGLGFSSLKLSRLAVWAADAAAVGGGTWDVGASGLDLQKLDNVCKSTLVARLSGVGVGNDDAITGASKQDDAKGCVAASAFLDEITIGRDANFVLWCPIGVASMSANDRDHEAAFFQQSPWFTR